MARISPFSPRPRIYHRRRRLGGTRGWAGQDVLVWPEKRRAGSAGATRLRLLQPIANNGKFPAKDRLQFAGQKTDEPFHYLGSIDDLKQAVADGGGIVYIVEGEVGVWSMHTMGIRHVIGICGITNIPKDIVSLFDSLGVTGFVYCVDNDKAGERGASSLRTILHESGWPGEGEYRKFEGPGIPDKGDANDLLCHLYPDISQARAALDTLSKFSPSIKERSVHKPPTEIDHDQPGWDTVKEAVRITLGIEDFNRKGFSKNFLCLIPHHEDKGPSAAWHKSGFYKCFACGQVLNAKETAELLAIDWRALVRPQPKLVSAKGTSTWLPPHRWIQGQRHYPLSTSQIAG